MCTVPIGLRAFFQLMYTNWYLAMIGVNRKKQFVIAGINLAMLALLLHQCLTWHFSACRSRSRLQRTASWSITAAIRRSPGGSSLLPHLAKYLPYVGSCDSCLACGGPGRSGQQQVAATCSHCFVDKSICSGCVRTSAGGDALQRSLPACAPQPNPL